MEVVVEVTLMDEEAGTVAGEVAPTRMGAVNTSTMKTTTTLGIITIKEVAGEEVVVPVGTHTTTIQPRLKATTPKQIWG